MDRNVAPLFSNLILNRWLAVRLELLGAAIMLATTVAVVLQRSSNSPGAKMNLIALFFCIVLLLTINFN